MKRWLADVWPLLTGRSGNPVYRRELARWSRVAVWRRAGRLVPVVIFGGAIVVVGVPMAAILPVYLFPMYRWSSVVIAAIVVLFIGQEIIRYLANLGAAVLAGVSIAAGLEDHTYDLLRLAPLSTRQIVLAKLAAALRPMFSLVIVLSITRLALVLMLGWSRDLLGMRASLNPMLFPGQSAMSPVVHNVVYGISVWGYRFWAELARQAYAAYRSFLWPVWLPYHLLQPAIDVIIFAAAGLYAASWARTRSGALVSGTGLGVALSIGSYLAGQMVAIVTSGILLYIRDGRFLLQIHHWALHLPFIGGNYVIVGKSFEVTLIVVILVRLVLLWLLIRIASRRMAARYGTLQESG